MKKYYSEAFEAMHEDFLAFFEAGTITEAELKEFEADAFIDEDGANEVGEPNEEVPLVTEDVSA